MSIATFSSRDFNQYVSEAKKATANGPVFITDRGKPSHVLLSIDDYRKLAGSTVSLADALAQRDVPDVEFEPPRFSGNFRAPELS